MPAMKPRPIALKPDHDTALRLYGHFLGDDPNYVLETIIDNFLEKDKEFAAWKALQSSTATPPRPSLTRMAG